MKIARIVRVVGVSLLLAGCAGGGANGGSVSGLCTGGRCTGVCVDEVKDYARQRLGSEATNVYFSFADNDPSPLSTAVVYFRTEACPSGEYQAEFFGTSQSCSNTYRGRLPENIGKLLVVPAGCGG